MNKYSQKLQNFLASIWKSFSDAVSAAVGKEKSVWAYTPVRAFGRGFTLVELLVVVLVIGILAAIAFPAYNRSVQKSRMSDALNVLDIAASKQQANYVAGEGYASSFDDLSIPVQGLTGNISTSLTGVKAGNFTYSLQNTCVVASRPEDAVTIYRNFNTDETGCVGDGCKLIEGVISAIPIGCDEFASEEEADSSITAPSVISCSFDKCLSSSGTCITTNSTCIQGRVITQACGNGGVQMKKCLEGCPNYWSDWSDCINQTCKESERPSAIDRAGCGYCKNGTSFKGVRTRSVTCNTSTGTWVTGSWSTCVNENVCEETSCSETNSCECASSVRPATSVGCGTKCSNGQYMGIQTRTVTCNRSTGEWFIASTGECAAELSCCPGEVSTNGCLWGVSKTCQANGQWGECNYKFCSGKEPESQRECKDSGDSVRTCGIQTRSVDCDLSKGEYITGAWSGTCTAPLYRTNSGAGPATAQFCGTCGSQDRTCQKTCDGLGTCIEWSACSEVAVPPTSQANSQYCSYHGTKNSPEQCVNKDFTTFGSKPNYIVDFENTGTCDCHTYFYGGTCSIECSLPGKYWNTGSCEMCTNSPVGRYWTGNGITSSTCPDASCTNKAVGYYWTGHGGTSSTCAAERCTNSVAGQYYTSFSNSAKTSGWDSGTSPVGCSVATCTNTYTGKYWNDANWTTSATGCSLGNCTNGQTAGKYYTGHGKASATGCATGNCTNATAGKYYTSFATKDINNGYKNDPSSCELGTCANVYAGKYWNAANWTTSATGCSLGNCTNDQTAGKYYKGHGGTSATACATGNCTPVIGKYFTSFAKSNSGNGYLNDATSCATGNCTNNYAGKYWSEANWTDSATGCTNSNCTNGQTAGKYYSGHGGPANSCATGNCTNAEAGTYYTSFATKNSGNGYLNDATSCNTGNCTNAQNAGYYYNSNGGTSSTGCTTAKCTNATAGQYYTSFAKSSSGKGYLNVATSCGVGNCAKNIGKYWTSAGAGASAGTSSTCSEANCTNTAKGKYFTSHGGTSATGCNTGNCTNNYAGKYWSEANWTINATGCTNSNCTNGQTAGKYYSGHGGSANSCATGNCTNAEAGTYYTSFATKNSGNGYLNDATSCNTGNCTNAQNAGYYYNSNGGTSSTGCTTAKCTNATAGQYYTSFAKSSSGKGYLNVATSCGVGNCAKNIGKYWTSAGAGASAGTSSTCSEANCTNTAKGKYFTSHGGTSATGCNTGNCTNNYAGKYWSEANWTTNATGCTNSNCTNGQTAGYYYSGHGGSANSCGTAKCTNAAAGQYYTSFAKANSGSGYLNSPTSCGVADCAKNTGYYWTNAAAGKDAGTSSTCSQASCTNKPTVASYTSHGGTSATGCSWSCPANTWNGSVGGSGLQWTQSSSACVSKEYVACPSGYQTGGNLGVKTITYGINGAAASTSVDYSACYGTYSNTSCSEYSTTFNQGSTSKTIYSNAAGTATRKTDWPSVATQCYYDQSGQACPSGYQNNGSVAVIRNFAGGTKQYNANGCYSTASNACPTGYTTGGNKAVKKVTCGSAWNSSNTCSSAVTTYKTDGCYGDTGSQACPSGYTSGGNVGVKRVTSTDSTYRSTLSVNSSNTTYNANGCYSTASNACPTGYTTGGNKAVKKVTCGSAWNSSNTCSSAVTTYKTDGCYGDTGSQACPSGYTSGGSVGVKRVTSTDSTYRSTLSVNSSSTTYNYYNCYVNGSDGSQTCPSGYISGGSVGVKNYRTYCGNTATPTQGACGTTRQSNVTYNYYNCYANGSDSSQTCPSGYTSGGSVGVKNYRTYCGNTATATQGACGTTRQSNVTYNYYNCYANGSDGSQTCPSGYTSGGSVGVKNYRTYCGNTATATQGACGTTRQSNVTYNYGSCYASGSASGQSCPSDYSGSSTKSYRTYCGNTATATQGACGTTSEKNVTYNLTGCWKATAASCSNTSSYKSGSASGYLAGVTCTNTAASSTSSCSTTTRASTANYQNCYYDSSVSCGSATTGQSCPSGYTSGGSVAQKRTCSQTRHYANTAGTADRTTSTVNSYTQYYYGSCYSLATSQTCVSGYTNNGAVAQKRTYCSTSWTTSTSCPSAGTVQYNNYNCKKTGVSCPSGYTSGGSVGVTTCGSAWSTSNTCYSASTSYSSCYNNTSVHCNTVIGYTSKCGSTTKRTTYSGAVSYPSASSQCSTCSCTIGTTQRDTNSTGTACTAPNYKVRKFCWNGSWSAWSSCSSSPSVPTKATDGSCCDGSTSC